MFVGVCQFKLYLTEFSSLKEKRSLLARLKSKVSDRFHFPLVEVEKLDSLQDAVMAFSLVSHEENYVRSVIDKVLTYLEESEGCRIVDEKLEVLRY
ncbi:MAG: DUF503 domain-containing protein [Deltaproteobacteria bacterium]|nr:DUF503 domain-containing protein [Deltaproteobacteria bacterium]